MKQILNLRPANTLYDIFTFIAKRSALKFLENIFLFPLILLHQTNIGIFAFNYGGRSESVFFILKTSSTLIHYQVNFSRLFTTILVKTN